MPRPPIGRVFETITDAIGGTPLVRLNRVIPRDQATVLGKCEFLNPCCSVKDRIGTAMIEDAERSANISLPQPRRRNSTFCAPGPVRRKTSAGNYSRVQ